MKEIIEEKIKDLKNLYDYLLEKSDENEEKLYIVKIKIILLEEILNEGKIRNI